MNFDLDAQQQELQGAAIEFARTSLGGNRIQADKQESFDRDGWRAALASPADAIYVETLSNPMLRVANLPELAALAHAAGALAIVDGTFTTPLAVRPVEHGFDLVLHSATKFLNGHSDVIAGVAAGSAPTLAAVNALAVRLGGCMNPQAAFLLEPGTHRRCGQAGPPRVFLQLGVDLVLADADVIADGNLIQHERRRHRFARRLALRVAERRPVDVRLARIDPLVGEPVREILDASIDLAIDVEAIKA